jgi:hypothetical protein
MTQRKKNKRTKKKTTKHSTQKTKNWATQISLKSGGDLISDNRRATLFISWIFVNDE